MDAKYSYRYPMGMDLKPGSTLHDRLRDAVLERARASHSVMSRRYASWNEIDQTLTSYIPLSELEEIEKEKDSRRPVSIVVPASQAVLETLLTYLVTAFLDDPIFRYAGMGPEDVFGARLLEMVVSNQSRRGKMGVQLHTMFRDSLAYGFGVVTPIWTEKNGPPVAGGTPNLLFEGNELWNIDPYNFLPDPGVAVQDVQRGEFVGWVAKENRMELLGRELYTPSMFNCRYLAHITGISSLGQDSSNREEGGPREDLSVRNRMDVIYQYINLVPKEWEVGKYDRPEKWLFGLAGDEVLICCGPLGLDHNMFPVALCSPDFDGYSVTPMSKVESVYGLQTLINFLYNSHIANVRKAINDMLVVDPQMINLNDLFNQGPGKLLRLRRSAWGRGVKGAVEQLPVTDVTRGHIPDASNITDVMEKVSGAVDSLQGIMRTGGERRSATEFEGTRQSALSRLERAARVSSLQAMVDLAYMIAFQTQQFMSRNTYVKLVGRFEEEMRADFGDVERVLVGPLDLNVAFDVLIPDGTLPTSGSPSIWLQMMQVLGANPELAQGFDMVRMFKHWARLTGAKNVNDFVRRADVQVMENEEVQAEAQAGNIIPMAEAARGLA